MAPSTAGIYSVLLSNFAGMTTSIVAQLVVQVKSVTIKPGLVNGAIRIRLPEPGTNRLVLETSFEMNQWVPIFTNLPGNQPAFLNYPMTNGGQFYRARP